MMPSIYIAEKDVVTLILEFLESRHLHISQQSIERETGVINGCYSDDLLFFRQLILDGQWDDVLDFIDPLEAIESFNSAKFRYVVLKQKYIEMLCIKSEADELSNIEEAVDEIKKLLSQLKPLSPTNEEYTHLCYLLTMPHLSDHADFYNWNPMTGRMSAFQALLPLVEKFLSNTSKESSRVSKNDRLVNLLIKGLLYEACLDYCQKKARSVNVSIQFNKLLQCENVLSDFDLSVIYWLQHLPHDAFCNPFEQATLNINVEKLSKPLLEVYWTEHMLVTPIKPKLFPYNVMPHGRLRAADIMSRSLNPTSDGCLLGRTRGMQAMTRSSLSSFQLTEIGKKPGSMVDQLYRENASACHLSPLCESPDASKVETKGLPLSSEKPSITPVLTSVNETPEQKLIVEYFKERNKDLLLEGSVETSSVLPMTFVMPNITKPLDSSIIDHLQASNDARSCFAPANIIEDSQAIRCAEFHPSGKFYGVGSNSRTLRVFDYPKISELRKNDAVSSPGLVCKKTGHHKGSIYCLGWNPNGDLIATGSNDKTLKLMRFDVENKNFIGDEVDITVHDGTIRDVCFIEDSINKSSLLISGGAGDCKVYITDCTTGKAFQAFGGHTSPILSLYTWGGAMFASGSQDKTVRFWDLRIGGCVSVVTPITSDLSINKGSAVASTCVDPSGRLLVTGHEDGACVFYDIRGARHVQMFKPHASDVRSVRFSPSAYYLLTAGYDGKLVLTDLQGDLTRQLPSVSAAQHADKIISARWHPSDFSFLSTSADKTCALWVLPPV
ncbi:WD repeat-containing protein 47-like [Artemia franciscana]|uniref:WD repeat-containing protein 47-like n=1 Tax=Artemia franciscana TaxID=6661 RepID=UPI0032DAB824